ncbi:hypothetical protein BDV95DRAFT_194891 [Massariosphaeria phaeospora]|uniref:Secreted protein n=1 Tax=Massariosphaeria phaeospora TaxID=100035 RepID=A0A7C8M3P1_9PLEO|nr:hypothetical protein BDV95DRAFT_194891 [Massariosphaeria phaeospora]
MCICRTLSIYIILVCLFYHSFDFSSCAPSLSVHAINTNCTILLLVQCALKHSRMYSVNKSPCSSLKRVEFPRLVILSKCIGILKLHGAQRPSNHTQDPSAVTSCSIALHLHSFLKDTAAPLTTSRTLPLDIHALHTTHYYHIDNSHTIPLYDLSTDRSSRNISACLFGN